MRRRITKLKQLNEENYHRTKTESSNNNDYLKRLSRNAIESIRRKTKRQKEINFNKNIYTNDSLNTNIKTKYTHLDKPNFFDSQKDPIISQNYNAVKDERLPILSGIAEEKREKLIKLFIPSENIIYEKKIGKDSNSDSFDKYIKKYTERKNIVSSEKKLFTRNNNNLGKTRTATSVHKNIFNTSNKESEDRIVNLNNENNNNNNQKAERKYEKNFTYSQKNITTNNKKRYRKDYSNNIENHRPFDIKINSNYGINSPDVEKNHSKIKSNNIPVIDESDEKNGRYAYNIYVPKKAQISTQTDSYNRNLDSGKSSNKKNITYNKKTFNVKSYIFPSINSEKNYNYDDINIKKEINFDNNSNNSINFDDENLRMLKEEISDISSIKSKSVNDSDTTINNNINLNNYLNNMNKVKTITNQENNNTKKRSTLMSPIKTEKKLITENCKSYKNINNLRYSAKLNNNNSNNYIFDVKKSSLKDIKLRTNEIFQNNSKTRNRNEKNSKNKSESMPHFIFSKRKTRDTPIYISEKNSRNKKDINIGTIKIVKTIKDDNEINEMDDENDGNSHIMNNNQENDIIIKYLEYNSKELFLLNKKYTIVNEGLINQKSLTNNYCLDFWNSFQESSLVEILYKLFPLISDNNNNDNILNKDYNPIVRLMINYLLMSIILVYDYFSKSKLTSEIHVILKEILSLNYKNFLLIFEYIINQTEKLSKYIWIDKIKNIIKEEKSKNNEDNNNDSNTNTIFDKMKDNNNFIHQSIKLLLINYKTPTNKISLFFNNSLTPKKTYQEINYFFKHNILIINNMNGQNVLPSMLQRQNKLHLIEKIPYIKQPLQNKKYTLIIGLEDIIINFKVEGNKYKSKGILSLRPGLNLFFEEISKFYEIIVFSLFDQKQADHIIDAFDSNNKYIDYRFYREHCIVKDNKFVKDLNRIGRDISKVIIIDNMPQCFELQKENGINIRSYWEEDKNDVVLLDLIPVLINIAKDDGDVRKGLIKYEEDIITKIS